MSCDIEYKTLSKKFQTMQLLYTYFLSEYYNTRPRYDQDVREVLPRYNSVSNKKTLMILLQKRIHLTSINASLMPVNDLKGANAFFLWCEVRYVLNDIRYRNWLSFLAA